MNSGITRRRAIIAGGGGAALSASALAQGEGLPDPIVTVVFIARHAEKDTGHADQRDPPLTEAGRARAAVLAAMLRDADLAAIYATQFKRSRETAQPVAERSGAPIRSVQHADYNGVAQGIFNDCRGRSALYIGHTNTVGRILEALGGPRLPDMDEANYSTMYMATVVRRQDLSVTTYRLLRYGAEA